MQTFQPFIILSAERADCDADENALRDTALQHELDAYLAVTGRKPVEGCYRGQTERAHLVTLRQCGDGGAGLDVRVRALLTLARGFQQESILLVDANRAAVLIYADGSREYLGHWRQVDKATALAQPSYTRDGANYYVCVR